MSIDKDKTKHISKLARISLDPKKTDALAKDLTSILNYEEVVKKIEKLTHLKHHELIDLLFLFEAIS